MNTVGLVVMLEAKPGKEKEVKDLLIGGRALVLDEPRTPYWFAFQTGPQSFGIFDVFPDAEARQAHLAGRLAAALMAKAGDLLAKPPSIGQADVLAEKVH